MRLIERIRAMQGILRRARAAAEAGKNVEEWEAEELEEAERAGSIGIWIQLIMALWPLIVAIFEQWRNR